MKPIVLIHGYSAESRRTTKTAITDIYGDLPKELEAAYGRTAVVEIDVSRYVSLEDGVTIDDISRGLERALQDGFQHLLSSGFHVIIHSTGALVVRNWVRRFSPKPSPIESLIYLAGANFGSGWAHIGRGQLAKWGRKVLPGGAERGLQVLNALELGSSWTLDLHLHFLKPANSLTGRFGILEHVVIGSQADASWYKSPIRYAKEDGSDGVVRVSGSNLNFNYLRYAPTPAARTISWREARREHDLHFSERELGDQELPEHYRVAERSRPGTANRPLVPFAIPDQCAHSGDQMGIVRGSRPRQQVMKLIDLALRSTSANWAGRVQQFEAETATTYQQAQQRSPRGWLRQLVARPRAQYDKHAQVIVRLQDQDGRPVTDFDIYFNTPRDYRYQDRSRSIRELIEDNHVNKQTRNVITFYVRTDSYDDDHADWLPQVPAVNGCFLEITAKEPETDEVIYLPLRDRFSGAQLANWIQPHVTTVIDVELLRLPSPEVFRIVKYSG